MSDEAFSAPMLYLPHFVCQELALSAPEGESSRKNSIQRFQAFHLRHTRLHRLILFGFCVYYMMACKNNIQVYVSSLIPIPSR